MYEQIVDWFSGILLSLQNSLPEKYQILVGLLFYILFIVLYSLFIWKFYRFLARKDIIQLNLSQYNYAQHPAWEKVTATALYIVEYLIILPFLVLFWFSVFSVFLLVLSKGQTTAQILLITAAIISATRITSYISEDLSKDVAKLFPFTALVIFLLEPESIGLVNFFDKIAQIPSLFQHILIFIIFIFIIEFILRGLSTIVDLISSED
ncbi:MAG: hypothetical protein WC438_01635 [Candidatus Pacearchaeota archaeon]